MPLLDWTGDRLTELIQDRAHIHPALKLCDGAAQVPATSKSKATTIPPAIDIEDDADIPQRWTAKRKAALVIDILQGKTTAAEAARQHALTLAEVEQWSRTQ